jgi:hypothetical protein
VELVIEHGQSATIEHLPMNTMHFKSVSNLPIVFAIALGILASGQAALAAKPNTTKQSKAK